MTSPAADGHEQLRGLESGADDFVPKDEVAEARAALNVELERRVIERTAELATANRSLAQKSQENEMFVYSVSHDLRSPLVNLQGFSQELEIVCQEIRGILAENELPAKVRDRGLALLDGDVKEYTRFIRNAVMRLSSIIDALLRLSRAGRIEYLLQEVDLQPVIARIIDAMSSTIATRGAKVIVHELASVWGDPTAVEQVFANLIGNALNYLDPKRSGVVEVGTVDSQSADQGHQHPRFRTFYVRDNGLGIPAAYQAKAFQVFQRLHPNAAAGEGMGLTIVRRIIERHGGTVWVESEVGVGSTFYVTFPIEGSLAALVTTTATSAGELLPASSAP